MVGEPGVGKSRLVWEFTHSHRVPGLARCCESASVSYGKATGYLPVIDLLRLLRDREPRRPAEDPREGDRQGAHARPGARARRCPPCWRSSTCRSTTRPGRPSTRPSGASRRWTRSSGCCCGRARSSRWSGLRGPALDRRRDPGPARSLVESLPAARLLLLVNYRPEYEHAWGGKTYYRSSGSIPCRPRAPTSCSTRCSAADTALGPLKRLLVERTEGNPFFLEESVRALVETGGPGRRARRLPARPARREPGGPGHRAGDPGRAHRPPGARGQAPAPGGRGHRQGRAAAAARWPSPTRRSRRCAPS